MTPALTKEEHDLVRWMDELDLEEVNLLDVSTLDEPQGSEPERLSGERSVAELPPSRGVGWDES